MIRPVATGARRLALAGVCGALVLIGAPSGAGAVEYLCTLVRHNKDDMIARAMLLDIRHDIYAFVFDEIIEASIGQPLGAEVTLADDKRIRLEWEVPVVPVKFGRGLVHSGGVMRKVSYFASLERKTMVLRVRAKAGEVSNMSAEGKCAVKKK